MILQSRYFKVFALAQRFYLSQYEIRGPFQLLPIYTMYLSKFQHVRTPRWNQIWIYIKTVPLGSCKLGLGSQTWLLSCTRTCDHVITYVKTLSLNVQPSASRAEASRIPQSFQLCICHSTGLAITARMVFSLALLLISPDPRASVSLAKAPLLALSFRHAHCSAIYTHIYVYAIMPCMRAVLQALVRPRQTLLAIVCLWYQYYICSTCMYYFTSHWAGSVQIVQQNQLSDLQCFFKRFHRPTPVRVCIYF